MTSDTCVLSDRLYVRNGSTDGNPVPAARIVQHVEGVPVASIDLSESEATRLYQLLKKERS